MELVRCVENRVPGETEGILGRLGGSEGEGVIDGQVTLGLEADGGEIKFKRKEIFLNFSESRSERMDSGLCK